MNREACLVLDNGTIFEGISPSWQQKSAEGEVVFSTGMNGYPESLTDPSYAGQILTFTYPLIGNYGVPPREMWESAKIHAHGVIINEACENWSHHLSNESFTGWLKSQEVPLISGIDTRALTKMLRETGTMQGTISSKNAPKSTSPPNSKPLVARVSTDEIKRIGKGKKHVIIVDCGIKEGIIRSINKYDVSITQVPYNYDYTQEDYDGILISNGPGDPTDCPETIAILHKAMQIQKPIFGICLGTQLMALAAGAKTYKLRYGHRGHNQPCQNLKTGRCYLTSQNHGYAICADTLPNDWEVTFINLNDKSVEGIAHKSKPFYSVQFHPEASPGPVDTQWMFEQFYQSL